MNEQKLCRGCGSVKGIDDFYRTKVIGGKAYYRGVCKECSLLERRGVTIERSSSGIPVADKDQKYGLPELSNALIDLSRHDIGRLELIEEAEFVKKTKSSHILNNLDIPFRKIKGQAVEMMEARGLCTPETESLGDGTYMIVGDSHGKHCKHRTFDLLRQINRSMKLDRIIHLGHMLDDDNEASYRWEDFRNLTVLAKPEELARVHELGYDIIRGSIALGDIMVSNQEHITDYRHTTLKAIEPELFPGTCIVNLHRLERMPRCSSQGRAFIASPGCLCEPHVIKTVRLIDFKAGYQRRETYPTSFHKYRKAKQDMNLWKQGIVLVKVQSGKAFVLQSSIKDISQQEKAVAIFNDIYTTTGPRKPEASAMIVADAHSPLHHLPTISLQEQVAMAYRPGMLMDLGDAIAFNSVNHHAIDKGFIQEYATVDMLKETASASYVLRLRSEWAPEKYFFSANHERFMQDFVKRNPQFSTLFTMDTLLGLSSMGYRIVDYKQSLKWKNFIFIHGDYKLFGMGGCFHDKLTAAFQPRSNEELVFGHVHYASCRNQVNSVGLSGALDQLYNEPVVSQWTQGFAWGLQYQGCAFIQLIDSVEGSCWFNKIFKASGKFRIPDLKGASLTYQYQYGRK